MRLEFVKPYQDSIPTSTMVRTTVVFKLVETICTMLETRLVLLQKVARIKLLLNSHLEYLQFKLKKSG